MAHLDPNSDRKIIGDLLSAGLETNWQVRAYTDSEIRHVVDALQAVGLSDISAQLRIAGFTLQPYVGEEDPEIEQSCKTCMYYESHRKYCNLPELKLGVEPEWSCVLWRV